MPTLTLRLSNTVSKKPCLYCGKIPASEIYVDESPEFKAYICNDCWVSMGNLVDYLIRVFGTKLPLKSEVEKLKHNKKLTKNFKS
jgi:hypothetical protein